MVRALSTSGTVEGVFSNRSSSDVKPSKENLIYRGPLSNMVKMVKLFSLSTSGISVIILQMMFMANESGALKVIGSSMAAILLLTPIVLHWITKSYVTKIYFDHATDTYTAYTVNFFLTTSKWEFTPADVEIPAIRNLMTSVLVKGKPLLLNPVAFYHPNHYSHLMGYDKLPDNFSLEELEKAYAPDSEEEQRKDWWSALKELKCNTPLVAQHTHTPNLMIGFVGYHHCPPIIPFL